MLYQRARLCRFLGLRAAAVSSCEAALRHADYIKAYQLMAAMDLPGESYFRLMARIHAHLRPATYVEIGVDEGESLQIVQPGTLTLGIDPQPRVKQALTSRQKIYAQTSDDFFATRDVRTELEGRPVELAFIDGMHQMEFALRDFINLERYCTPRSIVLIHDVYPIDARSAERERQSAFWTGDIWRLVLILKKHRPDLVVHTIGAWPSGLAMVQQLDPASRVLSEGFERIVAESLAQDYAVLEGRKKEMLNFLRNDWDEVRAQIERALRLAGVASEREALLELARSSAISQENSRKLIREPDSMEERLR